MYQSFAGVYDALMAQVDYAAWAAHYDALMQHCGVKKGAKCVECACGTGSLTLPLKKRGYQMKYHPTVFALPFFQTSDAPFPC